ncbi:FkbM family methyltransferase [Candidatus Dojkabacteria bacterium]|nr:FkbM family methyltransferase [Candidatus Dojkabacteria bacterium]
MTIDRRVSYFVHSFFEKYHIKGGKRVANIISKVLLPKPKNRIVVENREGLKMILDPNKDKGIEESLYFSGTYEAGVVNVIKRFLSEGDTFLEIGANIAPLSMVASTLVGSKGSVYAFEPDPMVKKMIDRNIKLNLIENINTLNIGLGDKKSSMKLYIKPEINRGASSLIKEDGNNAVEVNIEVLDSIYKNIGIKRADMIVIDVEGWEEYVLNGSSKFIRRFKPLISMELNSKYNPEVIYKKLISFGFYKIYSLKRPKEYISKLVQAKKFSEIRLDDNVFALTKEQRVKLSRYII